MDKVKSLFKKIINKISLWFKKFFKSVDGQPSGITKIRKSDGYKTFISSIICIIIGLLVGFLIIVIINPGKSGDAIISILKGGFNDVNQRKGIARVITKCIPLLLCSISIIFAYKCGLFNIGAPGQYVVGLMFCLLGVFVFKLPWYLCLLVSMVGGAIWGAIPGIIKAYLNVNEVITSIMFNWIGLHLTNWITGPSVGIMYDTNTAKCYKVPVTSRIPVIGKEFFDGYEYLTVALFITLFVVVLVKLILDKTKFGYEIKATGLNMKAAQYSGMNYKKNIIATMAISGAIAGLASACYYLNNIEQYSGVSQTSLPEVGFNGIAVAFLGGLDPIGAVFATIFITHITYGGSFLDTTFFPSEVANLITSIIIYLCAFSLFIKVIINKYEKSREIRHDDSILFRLGPICYLIGIIREKIRKKKEVKNEDGGVE